MQSANQGRHLLVLAGPEVRSAPHWPGWLGEGICEFEADVYAGLARLTAGDFEGVVVEEGTVSAASLAALPLVRRHCGVRVYLVESGSRPGVRAKVLGLGGVVVGELEAGSRKIEASGQKSVAPPSDEANHRGTEAQRTHREQGESAPPSTNVQAWKPAPQSPPSGTPAPRSVGPAAVPSVVGGSRGVVGAVYDGEDQGPLLTEEEIRALLGPDV